MFRSSQNLRLAAEMRALERVARPWRESRTSWFDGTPESVEARLAATERVLTHARAGTTTAHLALEREASAARAELREAGHRLMVDFLDDGARAFKGSRRVAGDGPGNVVDDEFARQNGLDPETGRPLPTPGAGWYAEMEPEDRPGYGEGEHGECQHCGERIVDYGGGWEHPDGYLSSYGDHEAVPYDDDDDDDEGFRTGSRRTAGEITDHEFKPYTDGPEYCQEELPSSGDTCNAHYSEHARVDPEDRRFLEGARRPFDRARSAGRTAGDDDDPLPHRHGGRKMPDGSDSPDEAESARYVLDFMHRKGIEELSIDDENRHPSYQRDFDDEEELDDAVAWVPRELIHNPGTGRRPWNPVLRRRDIEEWFARNPKHRRIPGEEYELPLRAKPDFNRDLLSSRRAENDEGTL